MLGSNQRPLPCEVRYSCSLPFIGVQKHLQTNRFGSERTCVNYLLSVCIGVEIVYKLRPRAAFVGRLTTGARIYALYYRRNSGRKAKARRTNNAYTFCRNSGLAP